MTKVVLITGAVRNSGLSIARRFAAEGYQVCVTSRSETDAQEAAAALERSYGVRAKGYGLDLQSVEDIKRVFTNIKNAFGRLDVFVGNSAHLGMGPSVLEMDQEQFDGVMHVNVRGNFFCCQQAALIMKEQSSGGSLVLIGSVHAKGAVWGRAAYATSKGAIASMVRNLAFELAEYGIRVNQVVPGGIRTDRWDGINDEATAKRRANWPLGVESTGDDIANAVYFIASDQARTITGTDLAVDSGVLACLLSYNGGKH